MNPPSIDQRLAARERPSSSMVGKQRWSELLFAHWKIDAPTVQATLPRGLFVDTFAGDAYIGVVPFFMQRVRPAWLPPLPWISWFLELNVRTYVHDENGNPGVWFYSLDCNQPIAVAIARHFFHLPYFHASMSAKRQAGVIRYQCQRQGEKGAPWCYEWTPGSQSTPAEPGSLEFFLIERYLLFSTNRKGHLMVGRVHHTPYRVHIPRVSEVSTGPAHLSGFDLKGAPLSLLAAESVDVSIFALEAARTP